LSEVPLRPASQTCWVEHSSYETPDQLCPKHTASGPQIRLGPSEKQTSESESSFIEVENTTTDKDTVEI